eukprot:COSAG02_NODE_1192_length_13974_cov_16.770378_9_plen_60_part_00
MLGGVHGFGGVTVWPLRKEKETAQQSTSIKEVPPNAEPVLYNTKNISLPYVFYMLTNDY